ncbi:auxin-induced protein 10A5-like [Salvia miltiorrhiza]|uniref:auxin-induced protein 10A5-like n=1 Tax=Salvia miltiorrhiza TaxID=226208 RepID=UPI0025AB60FB|nr:auxin-induced protein 10A5-like [Salvia miltiorrhiza]
MKTPPDYQASSSQSPNSNKYLFSIYSKLQNLKMQHLSKNLIVIKESETSGFNFPHLSPKQKSMAIRWVSLISNTKQFFRLQSRLHRNQTDVPKGHLAVYVGDIQKKRYVVPISHLNHPSFQGLLHRAEEEFGFNHPTGGLMIPCSENAFLELTSTIQIHHARNQ